MTGLQKVVIGAAATVVLIGAWVGVKSFTGKSIGEECHAGSDSDCKGMSAQCVSSKAGNYCSKECNADRDCPSSWVCGAIGVTEIDAKGNIKHRESSLKLCQRASAEPFASASASAAPSSVPAVASASAVPPPTSAAPATTTASPAATKPIGKPKPAPTTKPKAK